MAYLNAIGVSAIGVRLIPEIHATCVEHGGEKEGRADYVTGANIGGFIKVADAMCDKRGINSAPRPNFLKSSDSPKAKERRFPTADRCISLIKDLSSETFDL